MWCQMAYLRNVIMKIKDLFYLTAINGIKTDEGVTVERVESEGYTTRLRNNKLVVFHKGVVVAKGYRSNVENMLEGAL